MSYAFGLLTALAVLCAWLPAMVRNGAAQTAINHFWYFSLLWIVFFPLRTYLIAEGLIDLQIPRSWREDQLLVSLALAFGFWLSAFLGYLSTTCRPVDFDVGRVVMQPPAHGAIVVLFFVGLAWLFMLTTVFADGSFRPFLGDEQNIARTGRGPFFMLQTLYLDAFIAYAAVTYLQTSPSSRQPLAKWIVAAVIATSLIMTVAIASRRVIATVLFLLVTLYVLRKRKGGTLAICLIASTILAAPLLDAFRYMDLAALHDDSIVYPIGLLTLIETRWFWTSLSSSFEGVDHLAAFIELARLEGLLIGVDAGVAWLYNSILGLVPRALWVSKPEIYGSVAQQFFLYPWMYAAGPAVTTLPSTIVVDFTFGFGFIVALIMAFVLGRAFKVLAIALWSQGPNSASRIIPLFVMINVFNVVRGGTGFLQPLIVFAIVASFVIGFGPMFREIGRLLKLIFLPRSLRYRM